MSKSSCRCKKPHECEECPEWIFTFADLVMLMMGFFVILWVLKPAPGKEGGPLPPDEEWVKVAAAVREAFGYLPDPQSQDPVDKVMLRQKAEELERLLGPGEGGETKVKRQAPEGTDAETTSIRPSLQAAAGGRLMFDRGSAAVTPATAAALDQIADVIRGHRNIVLVKGHAALDDFEDGAAGPDTPQRRMALSLRRAQAVADYLTARNVDPEILRVQGCSTFEPVKRRTYEDNSQGRNRRVEVEVTATLVEERQSDAVAKPQAEVPAADAPPHPAASIR